MELPQAPLGVEAGATTVVGKTSGSREVGAVRRSRPGRSPRTHQLQQVCHVQRRQRAGGGRVLERQGRWLEAGTRAAVELRRCTEVAQLPQLVGALVGVRLRHLGQGRPNAIQIVLVRAIAEACRLVRVQLRAALAPQHAWTQPQRGCVRRAQEQSDAARYKTSGGGSHVIGRKRQTAP